jgi:hypothetical protein
VQYLKYYLKRSDPIVIYAASKNYDWITIIDDIIKWVKGSIHKPIMDQLNITKHSTIFTEGKWSSIKHSTMEQLKSTLEAKNHNIFALLCTNNNHQYTLLKKKRKKSVKWVLYDPSLQKTKNVGTVLLMENYIPKATSVVYSFSCDEKKFPSELPDLYKPRYGVDLSNITTIMYCFHRWMGFKEENVIKTLCPLEIFNEKVAKYSENTTHEIKGKFYLLDSPVQYLKYYLELGDPIVIYAAMKNYDWITDIIDWVKDSIRTTQIEKLSITKHTTMEELEITLNSPNHKIFALLCTTKNNEQYTLLKYTKNSKLWVLYDPSLQKTKNVSTVLLIKKYIPKATSSVYSFSCDRKRYLSGLPKFYKPVYEVDLSHITTVMYCFHRCIAFNSKYITRSKGYDCTTDEESS